MNLIKTGPNSARSEQGYEVARSGRFEIEYREVDRSATIEVEPGLDLALYAKSLQSWSGPRAQPIGAEYREFILRRVSGALEFLGIDHSIV